MIFQNPIFLWALFLAIIPIVLHLFDFRRARKIAFSNVRALKEISQKDIPRKRLKELLILFSRLLAFIFLVLAFANPMIPNGNNAMGDDILVAIDNSYSMARACDDASCLQHGRQRATILAEKLGSGQLYSLLASSGKPFYDKEEFIRLVQEIGLTPRPFDPMRIENSSDLVLVSDFQDYVVESTMKLARDTSRRLFLLPIEDKAPYNVFVDTLFLASPIAVDGAKRVLNVSLRNSGAEDASDILVRLLNEDRQISSVAASISAGQEKTYSFEVDAGASGEFFIQVEDNQVRFDNILYFHLPEAKKPVISIISADAERNLAAVFGNERLFETHFFGDDENMNFAKIFSSDLVLFHAFDALPDWFDLTRFKGDLVIVPSKNIALNNYEQKLAAQIRARSDTSATTISLTSLKSPFYRGIFKDFDEKSSLPQVKAYYDIRGVTEKLLEGRKDFLERLIRGERDIYWFNGTLETIQAHAIFLPLMYRIAENSLEFNRPLYFYLDDPLITLNRSVEQREELLRLRKSGKVFVPEARTGGNEVLLQLPNELNEPGHYYLETRSDTLGLVALNVPKVESMLDMKSSDELRELFRSFSNVTVMDGRNDEQLRASLTEVDEGKSLWKYALLLTLIFLTAESAIHRWMK